MSLRRLQGGATRRLQGGGGRLLQGAAGGGGLTATPHIAYYTRPRRTPRPKGPDRNRDEAVAVALLLLED